MVSAAVGFHCPECVRQGNQGSRPVRTVAGGRQRAAGGLVTKTLVAACVIVYGLQTLVGTTFQDRFDLVGSAYFAGVASDNIGVAHGEWYRLVTAMFLHASVAHLALNMVSLYVIGTPLETMLGRLRFTITYFVTGVAGNAIAYLFLPDLTVSLGASGAIFGLAGALLVMGYKLRYDMRQLAAILALNLVIDFTWTSAGIDWHAHVGGLGAGLVLGAAFAYAPRAWRWAGTTRRAPSLLRPTTVLPTACVAVLLAVSAIIVVVHNDSLSSSPTSPVTTSQPAPGVTFHDAAR
jgi:membrane associated rhomboid family serine protease